VKRVIYLLLTVGTLIQAEEILKDISVVEERTTEVVKNISGEELRSADLAEALFKNVPSISIIRRSGIANDISLRGQKRDNINVTIDGAKISGACVNRMDPPTSHVVTHTISDVEVQEGPFDVEEFGVLSGSVKVKTKKPTKEIEGEIALNLGSVGYKKASGTISGGSKSVKFLFSASTEEGEQYKDGNGDNFSEQLSNYTGRSDSKSFNYAPQYKNMEAFKKSMFMGKVFFDITDNQELRLSYTANRSDEVLYPSSRMDAEYDDSDMLNFEYSIKNLSTLSKKLDIQLYQSEVEHPMSTKYRVSTQKMGKYMTHKLTSKMQGAKLKSAMDIWGGEVTYGVDSSKRNWDGEYIVTTLDDSKAKINIGKSIDDVDTQNLGFFIKGKKSFGSLDIEGGARYDDTLIDTSSSSENDKDFKSTSANFVALYHLDGATNLFLGIGKSNRVPDARELYNTKYNSNVKPIKRLLNGNPSLNQTTNYEIDFGAERAFDNGNIKVKTFYSKLQDYIYYNSSLSNQNFENIDATIYGGELSGSYMPTDEIYLLAGVSYKRGKKDRETTGQNNHNLADINPLKLNAFATYDYDENGMIELSIIVSDRWEKIDSENGEQTLAGYGVVNLKTVREFDSGVELTLGLDNILDKTYATTNTYKDLVLMSNGSDTMLINEAGRYFYLNAKYSF
jgi:iron complex outermembrane receptor protein